MGNIDYSYFRNRASFMGNPVLERSETELAPTFNSSYSQVLQTNEYITQNFDLFGLVGNELQYA